MKPRANALRSVGLVLALVLSACATTPQAGPAQEPEDPLEQPETGATVGEASEDPAEELPTGPGLIFAVDPEDAEIVVNDQSYGLASDLPAPSRFIEVTPGIHRISVRKPGYATFRAEVTVTDTPQRIEIVLSPRIP